MSPEVQALLDVIKAPALSQIEAADKIPALVDAEVKAFGESEYLRGQASIIIPTPGTGELIYSQEDADKLVVQVRLENDEEVSKLTGVVSEKDVLLAEKDAKIAELEAAMPAVVAERDALRAAIQVEIEDSKVDTARLEQAVGPVAFR